MAITTFDQYLAAAKQRIFWNKSGARTLIAGFPFSIYEVAGFPAPATLDVGNKNNGLVPTSSSLGALPIAAFGAGNTGYFSAITLTNTVNNGYMWYDRLYHAGAFAYNDNITLTAQPAISARCLDYVGGSTFGAGTELWLETVTALAAAANITVTVTYTNEAGTAGRTTGATLLGTALQLGRMVPLTLQAGDKGVQKIESVICTNCTAGSFNILILRPLLVTSNNTSVTTDAIDKTGMPIIYATSCLHPMVFSPQTTLGTPNMIIEICNG